MEKPEEEEEEKVEPPELPMPEEPKVKNNYECKGVNVQLHFLKMYVP